MNGHGSLGGKSERKAFSMGAWEQGSRGAGEQGSVGEAPRHSGRSDLTTLVIPGEAQRRPGIQPETAAAVNAMFFAAEKGGMGAWVIKYIDM